MNNGVIQSNFFFRIERNSSYVRGKYCKYRRVSRWLNLEFYKINYRWFYTIVILTWVKD